MLLGLGKYMLQIIRWNDSMYLFGIGPRHDYNANHIQQFVLLTLISVCLLMCTFNLKINIDW